MGAAALRPPSTAPRSVRRRLAGGWARAYAAAWALTGAAAASAAAGGAGARQALRRLLGLSFPPAAPSAGHMLALWAHNLPICAWPMLLTPLGAQSSRRGRRAADALIAAWMTGNTAPVGAAIGAYGSRLLAYLPQLPVEWAALACGAGWWLAARRAAPGARAAAIWLAAACALTLGAAAIETYLAGRI